MIIRKEAIMKPLIPAPLLIVIASFDPNGNGKNDYDPSHPELLYDIIEGKNIGTRFCKR